MRRGLYAAQGLSKMRATGRIRSKATRTATPDMEPNADFDARVVIDTRIAPRIPSPEPGCLICVKVGHLV